MNNRIEENNIQTIVDVFGEHGITINYLCTEQGPTITRLTGKSYRVYNIYRSPAKIDG